MKFHVFVLHSFFPSWVNYTVGDGTFDLTGSPHTNVQRNAKIVKKFLFVTERLLG